MTRQQYNEWKPAYEARCADAHAEMTAFFESLPAWVNEDDYFTVWTMTEGERAEYFAKNAPARDFSHLTANPQIPYLKAGSGKKRESLAGVRI